MGAGSYVGLHPDRRRLSRQSQKKARGAVTCVITRNFALGRLYRSVIRCLATGPFGQQCLIRCGGVFVPKYEWAIVDHSCRECMGRLLIGPKSGADHPVRCAECGAEKVGPVEAMCWCGVKINKHGNVFECFRNPDVTAAAPQEIRVRERPRNMEI